MSAFGCAKYLPKEPGQKLNIDALEDPASKSDSLEDKGPWRCDDR